MVNIIDSIIKYACHLSLALTCLFVVLIAPLTNAATVEPGITLTSDNETLYMGDSVIIDVETVGLLEPLDVSRLFQYADLLRETTGTRIAVIEGRVVEVKLRRMEFIPKLEGRIVFGPLTGDSFRGPVKSNTLIIDVQPPADINWEPDANDLQISMSLSADDSTIHPKGIETLYVGQRLVATIELKHRHPIYEEQLTLPTFEGFDILPEYEERRTIVQIDDDNHWRVIAWRYHLFPQRSGKHLISGVQWAGTAVKSRTQRSEFNRQTTDTNLAVLPANETVEWWLPATAISLQDEWSKDPKELSAGDEIMRIITLDAENVLASHLPTVTPLESRALSSTLISQSREQQLTAGAIQATATFTYRMVAQSPIPVFLDTVRVPWFHTREHISKEAIIPARRINVGLPDRSDLLADIALQNHWWDRLSFKLSNSGISATPWHISFAVLCLLCAILGIKEWVLRRRETALWAEGKRTGGLPEL